MDTSKSAAAVRIQGQTLVLFAFDIKFQIDLEATERLLRDATRQRVVRSRRPAPISWRYMSRSKPFIGDVSPEAVGPKSAANIRIVGDAMMLCPTPTLAVHPIRRVVSGCRGATNAMCPALGNIAGIECDLRGSRVRQPDANDACP